MTSYFVVSSLLIISILFLFSKIWYNYRYWIYFWDVKYYINKKSENSQGKDHGWFLAYGPFDDPNIVVAVLVEQGGFGAQSAVPIGKKILEAAFGIVNPEEAAQK